MGAIVKIHIQSLVYLYLWLAKFAKARGVFFHNATSLYGIPTLLHFVHTNWRRALPPAKGVATLKRPTVRKEGREILHEKYLNQQKHNNKQKGIVRQPPPISGA